MTEQQRLEAGLAHHRAGRLGEAEQMYREILGENPKNADALFLLGSLSHQTGKLDDAVKLLNQAIEISPGAPNYHTNLGVVLATLGRLPEAAECYRKTISLMPHAAVYFNLGTVLSQMNVFDSAANAFRQAIALDPNHHLTHMMLGNALKALGQKEDAVAAYQRAVALNPQFPDTYNNLGGALADLNRLDKAVAAFRQSIALKPDFAQAYNNLGQSLTDLGRFDEAVTAIQRALTLRPIYALGHNSLGIAFQRLGRLEDARAAFHEAMKQEPQNADYVNHMGMILGDMGRLEEAFACFQQALALRPGHADYLYNMGIALEDLGRPREALDVYREVLKLRHDFPEAHHSNGLVHLLLGDFRVGLVEYEWRAKCPHIAMQRKLPQPRWTGDDPRGKTILLHWEQGLGDTIHFIRYATLLAERGAKVVVKCQPQLLGLIKCVEGVADAAAKEEFLPPFDLECPLLSLPLAFETTLETIPRRNPYISASPERVTAWRERIGPADGRLRVGIAWAGQPKHRNDRRRSMRLEQFAPLGKMKSSRFFSLQKIAPAGKPVAPPPEMDFVDWTSDLHDFEETAALIANLDLVICVDTSVAHLAGAMGKPVWVLLPFVPDWRWMLDRSDSPWYPTMRLFRQPEIGDWDSVIENVSRALSLERAR
ncbi:MAG TPA: tetratricopeptide repeat protein [Tepidisphaeraceae bacterium]